MKMGNTLYWALGSTIVTVIGAVIAFGSAYISEKNARADKLENDRLVKENQRLLRANFDKSLIIINRLNKASEDYLAQNIQLRKQVKSVQRDLSASVKDAIYNINRVVTGGSIYLNAYISLTPKERGWLYIINNYKSPVPGSNVIIRDYSFLENETKKIRESNKKHTYTFEDFTFYPGRQFPSAIPIYKDGKIHKIDITYHTLGETYYQLIIYRVDENERVGWKTITFVLNKPKLQQLLIGQDNGYDREVSVIKFNEAFKKIGYTVPDSSI